MTKKKINTQKTNAVRIVEAEGIPYKMYEYDAPEGFLDGVSVAEALHQNPAQVFKTLVTVGSSREYHVCVIPVCRELDLKKSRQAFCRKKARDDTGAGYHEGDGLYQGRLFPGRNEKAIYDCYRCFCREL